MVRDSNEYEVVHTINISMELADGSSKSISSTFKIIPAKSLSDAKKKLDDATPKGAASMMSESSLKSYKHIYVEDINGYVIKHTIYVNKNGIKYKEPSDNLTNSELTPEDLLIDSSRISKEDDVVTKDKPKSKSNKKKTNTSRSKSSNKKSAKKSSSKSSSKKKSTKTTRTKRTTVDYID